MREINITANDAGRRLDRFLRKYLSNASLSEIYKLIRKDVKVSGKRRDQAYILQEGDLLSLYVSDDVLGKLTGQAGRAAATDPRRRVSKTRKQFRIIYEDSNILVADKPYGLLTHGDSREKKNHLANQVKDYLISRGEFDPGAEKVFSPAPVNRLDRNTTGLVLFGKTSSALKGLNRMIREDLTDKFYMTVVHGILKEELVLTGDLVKDEENNRVRISRISAAETGADGAGSSNGTASAHRRNEDSSLPVLTEVTPLEVVDFGHGMKATLVRIRLVTGRSHQIRAHMAGIGHPVVGDSKYAGTRAGDAFRDQACRPENIRKLNEHLERTYGLSTQLLHAYRIHFAQEGLPEDLAYLGGRSFTAPLPQTFNKILGRQSFE